MWYAGNADYSDENPKHKAPVGKVIQEAYKNKLIVHTDKNGNQTAGTLKEY
jgi:hypothetical protein